MKLTNHNDDAGEDVFRVGDWLEVWLEEYDVLVAVLPDGRRVQVFTDQVLVGEPDTPPTQDGKQVWSRA